MTILVLEDRNGASTNDFYVFSEARDGPNLTETFTKSGFAGLIWYDGAEQVTLKGTQQDSTTNVRAVHGGTQLNLNVVGGEDEIRIHASERDSTVRVKGGDGDDTVRIAPDDQVLRDVAGNVEVDGQGGSSNRLYMSDRNSASSPSYHFRETLFFGRGMPTYSYHNFSEVRLNGSDTGSLLFVHELLDEVHLRAFLNGGNDTAFIGWGSQDVDSFIRGDLTIWGGAESEGHDRVEIFDQNDTANDSYEITPTTFRKNSTSTWTISQFERHSLEANNANNTIHVQRFGSLSSDPQWDIFGNNGDDELVVGSGLQRTTFPSTTKFSLTVAMGPIWSPLMIRRTDQI